MQLHAGKHEHAGKSYFTTFWEVIIKFKSLIAAADTDVDVDTDTSSSSSALVAVDADADANSNANANVDADADILILILILMMLIFDGSRLRNEYIVCTISFKLFNSHS